MAIDPKILARIKTPPEDDGSEGAVFDDEPELKGMPVAEKPLPEDRHPGCATLTGTWKQRKWAIDLRNVALGLKWPDDVYTMLRRITDSTWWIANRSIVTTMKFKKPAANQIEGDVPSALYMDAMTPLSGAPPVERRTPSQKRLDDAMLWAESVSRHPTLAQAAILSCLRLAYPKGEMRNRITAKARELLAQANMEVNRDTDAIQLMLSKE